ncbi:hypothetical protein OUZ56_003724 [Daphnia magna]|uniref:Uncharacterized protein n=1 Tax=Daphnia magna TaxID=35525 RepID=A0ABR0A9J4_9CRUS|nr:hypothetical protein OUZ56_003724 [Daphnia magna]
MIFRSARPYTLWKELEETIPKGVFRRLRIPEPFPEQKHQRQEHRKITPYSRPVPESLAIPPLLSADEMTQLHALHRAEHRTRQKEKEKLILKEKARAKATKKPAAPVLAPAEPQPGTSKSSRPQTLLEKIYQEIKAQTIPKPLQFDQPLLHQENDIQESFHETKWKKFYPKDLRSESI